MSVSHSIIREGHKKKLPGPKVVEATVEDESESIDIYRGFKSEDMFFFSMDITDITERTDRTIVE